MPLIDSKSAVFFSNQLRSARLETLADAEAFDAIVHAVERLGSHLSKERLGDKGKDGNLGQYAEVKNLVRESGAHAGRLDRECMLLPSFGKVYDLVRDARNDAVHTGAFARHLAEHAITLAIILEDALSHHFESIVSEFMVSNPVCVEAWQPVGFVRHQMLANSFSCLPVLDKDKGVWKIVTDREIAVYLKKGIEAPNKKERTKRLAQRLDMGFPELQLAEFVKASDPISTALLKLSGTPFLLVKNHEASDRILGVVTPFDLL